MYFNPLFSTLLVQAVIDKLLHFSQLDAQYINQANLDFSSSSSIEASSHTDMVFSSSRFFS